MIKRIKHTIIWGILGPYKIGEAWRQTKEVCPYVIENPDMEEGDWRGE